ncbi:MAG: MAPEG family protein [Proteobacteria bacterium]|nr:MAPEG family protein [Pseudomonadota bacterium]
MNPTQIVWPVIVQALLTLTVLILLGPARSASMKERRQTLSDPDVRLSRNEWSEQATKISRNYANQFELPVLFYAVCAFALLVKAVDFPMLALAWVFAISRLIHAAVHVGPNIVMVRGLVFLVGAIAVGVMWVMLAIHLA